MKHSVITFGSRANQADSLFEEEQLTADAMPVSPGAARCRDGHARHDWVRVRIASQENGELLGG